MSNSLGKASIILTADAASLSSGLNKAAAESKKKGAEIKGHLQESLQGATGGVGSIIGGVGKAGVIGAVISGAILAAKEIYEAQTNIKKFHRELEAGQQVIDRWGEALAEKLDKAKERLAGLDDIAGTSEGVKAYGRELAVVERGVTDLEAALARAKKTEEGFDSKWDSVDNFRLWTRGRLEDTANNAKEERQKIEKFLEAQRKAAKDMRQQKFLLENPLANDKAKDALRGFIADMNDATAAIGQFGKTADELSLEKLQRQFGFKDADLGAARLAILNKNMAMADDLIRKLERDISDMQQGIERSAEEEQLDALVRAGIDKQKADRIRELINLKKQEADANKAANTEGLKALDAKSWDGIRFVNKVKADTERANKLSEKQLNEIVQQLVKLNLKVAGLNVDAPEF